MTISDDMKIDHKELNSYGQDVSKYVPKAVWDIMNK